MPLNLSAPGEGNFLPILKYNAKAGRWYIRDDAGDDQEVQNLQAVFDLANIRTGWLKFSEAGPDWVADPGLDSQAPRPSDEHKRAFKVDVFSEKQLGGVREWMSNSMMATGAVAALYAEYEKQAGGGKLPVVSCKETKAITGKHGTNYEPVLTIDKMIDRPAAFSADAAVPASAGDEF